MKQLKDIMTKDVQIVSPDSTLSEVARKMRTHDTGVLPVCDGRRIQGMITDRDIVVRAIAEGRDPSMVRASEIMTHDVIYCYEDHSVREAAKLMQSKQIRRLIVLDRQKNLCGIVSIGDLAMEFGDSLVGETLEQISEPVGSHLYSHRGSSMPGASMMRRSSGFAWAPFAFGASVLGAGYWFLNSRPELRDRLMMRFRSYTERGDTTSVRVA